MADFDHAALPLRADTHDPLSLWTAGFLLASVAFYFFIIPSGHSKDGLAQAPGPRGWPIIGNLPEVIRESMIGAQHLLFEKWAREYGPVYQVKVGFFTQYMVNSDVATKALFDGKNASSAAERPRWVVSNEQICNEWNVLLLNASTPRWKLQRKVAHGTMTSISKADAGLPALHYESLKFLYEVANDPAAMKSNRKLWDHLQRYTYSTFTTQTMGFDVPRADSPAIEYIHETGKAQIIATLPGSHFVDIFPILDKLPLLLKPWERDARARHQRDLDWLSIRLAKLKAMPDRSGIEDSLISKVIDDPNKLGFSSELEGIYFALMMTIGAADTSQVSTWSFQEAMLRHPAAQRKGQAAVDAACGDRLPVFEDLERIPYLRCLLKETWRWRPPVPLGHPHAVTKNMEYEGMLIPAGTRIHLNAWAIQHDPARHSDPDEFIPERYEHDGTSTMQSINSSDVKERDHFAFGAGRRICPGYNVAERSLAVSIMRILWAFDVEVGENAKLPLDSADFRGLMPGVPGPDMPVNFRARHGKKELIERAFAEAEKERAPIMSIDL